MLHRFEIHSAAHVFARKQCILWSALRYKNYLTVPYVASLRDSFCRGTFTHGFLMLPPRSLASSRSCSLATRQSCHGLFKLTYNSNQEPRQDSWLKLTKFYCQSLSQPWNGWTGKFWLFHYNTSFITTLTSYFSFEFNFYLLVACTRVNSLFS